MTTKKHEKRLDRCAGREPKEKNNGHNKRNDADDPLLKTVFNRVVSHPDRLNGQPYLINTDIPVNTVIDLLSQGANDEDIKRQFNGLTDKGLDICEAYQVRFRPETLPPPFKLDKDDKFFLLDENISYLLLYETAKFFGFSTHVSAEGMSGHQGEHHDDEKDIWAFAVKEQYKAILTADSDFVGIVERYRTEHKNQVHTPVVIHIDPKIPAEKMRALLITFRNEIQDFARQSRHPVAFLSKNGLGFETPDSVKEAARKKAEANIKPSL